MPTAPPPVELGHSRVAEGWPALAVSGLAAGALGAVVGWRLGGEFTQSLPGALIGAAAGEAVALPLGVHWAGGRRGDYGSMLLSSSLIAAAGLLASFSTWEDRTVAIVAVAVPIAQLLVAIPQAGSSAP